MKCFSCGWELLELSQRDNRCYRCGADLDPNYCGLGDLNTGKYDPFWQSACTDHDLNMSYNRKTPFGTALEFTVDALNTAVINTAKAVYSVTFAIPYIWIGAVGGFVRDVYKRRGRK